MITVHLIRHGTTEPNTEGKWAGSTDVSITRQAEAELGELSQRYPYPQSPVIYRSPLIRCKQTLEAIYPGREAVIIEDLRELDFGDYEGAYEPDALKELGTNVFCDMRLDFTFPGGEAFGECLNRGIRALDQIVWEAVRTGTEEVLVVTHSVWMSVLLKYCLNPEGFGTSLFCGNGFGITILIEEKEWSQKRQFHFGGYIPEGAQRPRYEDSPYKR